MDNSAEEINNLILELSLATSLPVGTGDKEDQLMMASAATNAMASRTQVMERSELRNFEWTIRPLLDILVLDLQNPVTAKAALALRSLMPSRVCMTRFLEDDGLTTVSKVMDILLARKVGELKTPGVARSVVEHLTVCYREIARFYQWRLVDAGGIRHCVLLLRFGDVQLQTITATTLASLSSDLAICKQMFSYGAIKPLIVASDGDNTNEACMLAGLGCITQLCRIPEIGVRMVQQGAVLLMEKAILRYTGHGNQAIREKALHTLGYLSQIAQVKSKICTTLTLRGIHREFHHGTMPCRLTALQLLMSVHLHYKQEVDFVRSLRDEVLRLLKTAPWSVQNLCVKAICVLYRTDEDRMFFAEHGLIEAVLAIIESKNRDLQEAPLVLFLNLCSHAELPPMLLARGVQSVVADLLLCDEPVIRELAVILLKTLLLYNHEEVEKVVPAHMSHILVKDVYNPQQYGAEYGGLIQEFLQEIVENRRDQDYLLSLFSAEEISELALTDAELEDFQLTFMELDVECRKSLGVDELKLLMVLMGERMDKDEIRDLLEQYDTDKSGDLDFKEFVIMMKGWDTRFGTGLTKFYRIKTQRGAIGKARRAFKLWAQKDAVEEAEVQLAKQRIRQSKQMGRDVELQFLTHEHMKERRHQEQRLRQQGLSQFASSQKLPLIHRPMLPPPMSPPQSPKKSRKSLRSSLSSQQLSPRRQQQQQLLLQGSQEDTISSIGLGDTVSSSLESAAGRVKSPLSSRRMLNSNSRPNSSSNQQQLVALHSSSRIDTFSPSTRPSSRSPKKSVRLIDAPSDRRPFSPAQQQQSQQQQQQSQRRSVGFAEFDSSSLESYGNWSQQYGNESPTSPSTARAGFSAQMISEKYTGAFSPVNANIQLKRASVKAAASAAASAKKSLAQEQQQQPQPSASRRGGLLSVAARSMVAGSMIDVEAAATQEMQQQQVAAQEQEELLRSKQLQSKKSRKTKKTSE